MPGAATLAIAATIVVRITALGDFNEERRAAFEDGITRGLAEVSGPKPRFDKRPQGCVSPETCVAEVRGADREAEVVLVQLLVGPRGVRCVAQRARAGEAAPGEKTELLIPVDALESGARTVVRRLYPRPAPDVVVSPPILPPPPPGASVLPWVLIGSGVAVAATGVVFGVVSHNDVTRAETEPLPSEESQSLYGSAHTLSLLANLCFALGAASSIVGVAFLIGD